MRKKAGNKNRFVWNDSIVDVNNRSITTHRFVPLTRGREVGVEIECEGRRLPVIVPEGWSVHRDGSLRSQRPDDLNYEYVFLAPVNRTTAVDLLHSLRDLFTAQAVDIYENSPRTSVHVHIDQTNLTVKQICNQIVLFLIFEDLLTDYCGPTRVGNLFCLRGSDSEIPIQNLVRALTDDRNWTAVANENMRYAGLNIASLFKFGSLEYRQMRGTGDFNLIERWMNLLFRLKDRALEFTQPNEIIEQMSMRGPRQFALDMLGEDFGLIVLNSENYDRRMYDGVRLAQDLAYAVDWAPNPTEINPGWTGTFVDEEVEVLPPEPAPPVREMPVNVRHEDWVVSVPDFGLLNRRQILAQHTAGRMTPDTATRWLAQIDMEVAAQATLQTVGFNPQINNWGNDDEGR